MSQLDFEVVTKEIFIECRAETLFSFFTEPEKMVRWIGRHVLLEPKVGGIFRIDMSGKDVALGEYVEVVPYEKIVITWGWEKSDVLPPGFSTVEFQFTPKDNGTLLVLKHSNLPAVKSPMHAQRWTYYIGRLKAVVEDPDLGVD